LYGKDITSEYMIKMGKDEKEEEERWKMKLTF
jgi:hypothetical protein